MPKTNILVHVSVVGNDVVRTLPEIAVRVVVLRHNKLVHGVHALSQVGVAVRQLALLHKGEEHVLHIPDEGRLVVVGGRVDAEDRGDVRRCVGDSAKLAGSFLCRDVRVDVGHEIARDVRGQVLEGTDGSDVRHHGRVLEPVIAYVALREVVESHRLSRNGGVEAAEFALDVCRERVVVGPVHELLVVAGHLALSC